MNDQDKPIGAPKLDAETKAEDHAAPNTTPPPPPTPNKKKLNWKGFFFGILAVIIIEFFAVSMLKSGDPQIPLSPPPAKPSPTKAAVAAPTQQSAQMVVSVLKRGGHCMVGSSCESTTAVDANGSVMQDKKETKKLTAAQIKELQTLITQTDFEAIKKTKFSGTCPIAYDGQEAVYTVMTANGKEELPSCTYNVDENAPLFKFLAENVLN